MRALILLLVVAGCYTPAVERCQYTCAADACPDGLTCNFQGVCATTESERCPSTTCGWPAISNVDPCAAEIGADGVTADWTIDTALIDTGDPGAPIPVIELLPTGAKVVALPQPGGPEALVIVVQDLTITKFLEVRGARPLILLANGTATVARDAGLFVLPGLAPPAGVTCAPAADLMGVAASADNGGGGGGGGGFGRRVANTSGGGQGGSGGGQGGAIDNGGAPGRLVLDTEVLVPLRGGCAGGSGGGHSDPPVSAAGLGGQGGSAIQISARTSLSIRGMIGASGLGGNNAGGTHGGGGGGGAGGGILLEAPAVVFEPGSFLCANGGGGGAGNTEAIAASGGSCGATIEPAIGGGAAGSLVVSGGRGGTELVDAEPGKPGQPDAGTGPFVRGGGGGGGGVGRIRVNGAITGAPTVSTPAFSAGPLL